MFVVFCVITNRDFLIAIFIFNASQSIIKVALITVAMFYFCEHLLIPTVPLSISLALRSLMQAFDLAVLLRTLSPKTPLFSPPCDCFRPS